MRTLETVVIKYTTRNRVEYQKLAEFLRLAGIFVWEFPKEFHTEAEQEADFGDALVLNVTGMIKRLDEEGLDHEWSNLYVFLQNALTVEQENPDAKSLTAELSAALPGICQTYEKRNLACAAAALQYFRMNAKKVLEISKLFEEAAEDFAQMIAKDKSLQNNRHLRYAYLYCKQKANLGRWLCHQPLLVLADVLADECLELVRAFPEFSNALVLRGLAYEPSERYSKEAVEAFNQAVMVVGNYPYASSIYYWIGKRCEPYRSPDKEKLRDDAYAISYKLDPKYRPCYKMAFVSERWFRWKETDRYYRECLAYISQKGDYLDPLEQEYSYKAAIRAAYNCLAHLEDVKGAIKLLLTAEELRKNIAEGKNGDSRFTKYYFDLYGADAPDYIELELGRMGTLQLYQYLSKAYQIVGNQQEAMRYNGMFETEREKAEKKQPDNL